MASRGDGKWKPAPDPPTFGFLKPAGTGNDNGVIVIGQIIADDLCL